MESHRKLELLPHHRALIRIAISNGPFNVPNQSWLVEVVQVQRVEKLDSMPLGPRTRILLLTNLFASEFYEMFRLWFKGCRAPYGLGSLVLLIYLKAYRKFWNGYFLTQLIQNACFKIENILPFTVTSPFPQPWFLTHPWAMSLFWFLLLLWTFYPLWNNAFLISTLILSKFQTGK